MQSYTGTARFCLICNYSWCLSESLQNSFLKLQFSQLPAVEIHALLANISKEERLGYSAPSIEFVRKRFESDIRSMINFMHSHPHPQRKDKLVHVVNDADLRDLLRNVLLLGEDRVYAYVQTISQTYNSDPRMHMLQLLHYVVDSRADLLESGQLLRDAKRVLQFVELPTQLYVEFLARAIKQSSR